MPQFAIMKCKYELMNLGHFASTQAPSASWFQIPLNYLEMPTLCVRNSPAATALFSTQHCKAPHIELTETKVDLSYLFMKTIHVLPCD